MSRETVPRWKRMRTAESRKVEHVLRADFPQSDAYEFNSASIRVRVVDEKFRGKSPEQRDGTVEVLLKKLPKAIQAKIINLLTLAPDECAESLRNHEFEDPSRSML